MNNPRYHLCQTLLAVTLFLFSVNGYSSSSDKIQLCDDLAGNAQDPELPGSGVSWEEIDAARAIKVCSQILKQDPAAPQRIKYQLLRAQGKLYGNDRHYIKNELLPEFLKLAKLGHLQSAYSAAYLLFYEIQKYPIDNKNSYNLAESLFIQAKSIPNSLYQLAQMYEEHKLQGASSDKGHQQLIHKIYEQAAENGHLESAYIAGMDFILGARYQEKNIEKGFSEFLIPNANKGHLDSAFQLGKFYMERNDEETQKQGFAIIKDLVQRDNLLSIKFLADKYYNFSEYTKAANLLLKAIELDDNDSRITLANLYLGKLKTENNSRRKAKKLLVVAAQKGGWKAKFALAEFHSNLEIFEPLKSIELYKQVITSIDDIPYEWNPRFMTKQQARQNAIDKIQKKIDSIRTIALVASRKHIGDEKIIDFLESSWCLNCNLNNAIPKSPATPRFTAHIPETITSVGAREVYGSKLKLILVKESDNKGYAYEIDSRTETNYCFNQIMRRSFHTKNNTSVYTRSEGRVNDIGVISLNLSSSFNGFTYCYPFESERIELTCETTLQCSPISFFTGNPNKKLSCDVNDKKKHQLSPKKISIFLSSSKKLEDSLKTTLKVPSRFTDYAAKTVCYQE